MFGIQKPESSFGAEITGLDLSEPLDSGTVAELRNTWLKYRVLVFRDQNLSPAQQLQFTEQFGALDCYPFLPGIPGYPLVAPVLKLPQHKVNFGGVWHSDTAYLDTPAMGATLYALELPPVGGDTIFADMVQALATLPQTLVTKIANLRAINRSDRSAVSQTRGSGQSIEVSVSERKVFSSEHPVVRTHPETGEQLLYVNAAHTEKILGVSKTESNALLSDLVTRVETPELQFRIKWQVGTLVLWDNRTTQHFPINDYPGHRRLLHRVSLKGDKPV